MTTDEPSVVVGGVAKALGLKGEVFVRPDPDIAFTFSPGQTFGLPDGRQLVVADARLHSGRQVMRFEGYADRDAVATLRGAVLEIPRDSVELDDESFWNDELLGREVVDDSGSLVGVLESTMDGAAHDYLVVARTDGGEVLIPAVADLVEIQPDRIVVHAIPGLLDIQDS